MNTVNVPEGRRGGLRQVPARRAGLVCVMLVVGLLGGCGAPAITFPAAPLSTADGQIAYDVNHDGKPDFFCMTNAAGRIDRIGYDTTCGGKPDTIIHLDAIEARHCRHMVLVLDGFPSDVVNEFHQQGRLRLFDPPTTVIPPYPVMTDLAMEDAFGYMPCMGPEAKYYCNSVRATHGGTMAYLRGKGEPFAHIINYRANMIDDGISYLYPGAVFASELRSVKREWDKRQTDEFIAYFVSSAGMGTRKGKPGQLQALAETEQLMMQVLYESRGLVKFTLMADHGQTNVPAKCADLAGQLEKCGWHVGEEVKADRDVALVNFGLVTFAAMGTRQPSKVADDLLAGGRVTLASWAEGDSVVVRSRDGEAVINSTDGKTFQYVPRRGDPLKLGGLANKPVDGREVFRQTVAAKAEYPDALYRLWRAHFGLMENVPTLMVDTDDCWYSGSATFAGLVNVASTHGGLNWRNSATCFMTTAGPVEGPLRSEDIPPLMRKLLDRPWPYGR